MGGTLEVAFKAYLHPRRLHCIDDAQKGPVLSAVIYIYIYIFFYLFLFLTNKEA